jgi:hypothetical protein
MEVLFLLFFNQKAQLGLLPFLFFVLKAARSVLAVDPMLLSLVTELYPMSWVLLSRKIR